MNAAKGLTLRTFESIADLAACKGQVLGVSSWVTVTQDAIDKFADATGDDQWIHVDRERSAAGPYGTTIAHGLMSVALLAEMTREIYTVKGVKMFLNYGFNKVRFPAPVPAGSKVRAQCTLVDLHDVGNGASQVTLSAIIELDGSAKPAAAVEIVFRCIT